MKHNSIFIGMDVHKNSIDIAIAESGRTGQVRHYGKINGTLAALKKLLVNWSAKVIVPISCMKPVHVDTRFTVTSQPGALTVR